MRFLEILEIRGDKLSPRLINLEYVDLIYPDTNINKYCYFRIHKIEMPLQVQGSYEDWRVALNSRGLVF